MLKRCQHKAGVRVIVLWLSRLAIVLSIAFLLIDIFPRFGPPDFRYTGSDPARHVWNIGWPIALAIFDSESGIHVGPFIYAVPIQLFVISAFALPGFLCRRRNKSLSQS